MVDVRIDSWELANILKSERSQTSPSETICPVRHRRSASPSGDSSEREREGVCVCVCGDRLMD